MHARSYDFPQSTQQWLSIKCEASMNKFLTECWDGGGGGGARRQEEWVISNMLYICININSSF